MYEGVTTGSYNTMVGVSSGRKMTSGASNSGLGVNALEGNTTGANNTGIGMSALAANTTGVENIAIGKSALACNTTTGGNVAIGYNSQYLAVGGLTNVSIGPSSFTAALTGADNTGVGPAVGISLTSGSNNLLLGHDAGRTGSPGGAISTASNRIVLGDENISNAHIQVDWTVASDQRDKTDFNNLDLGLDFVNKLNPVTYKWDKRSKYNKDLSVTPTGEHKEDWLDIGFKAQEVEALEIEAGYNKDNKTNLTINLSSDGKQYGVQYAKFVPILVNAIKELKAEIELLKNK
jgi:hypothetical protein